MSRVQSSSAASDRNLLTSDITTNNASTTKHGFLKKLSNTASDFMNGVGNWVNPMTVLANPYKFSAYRSTGALTISSAADTQVTFDTEEFDTGGNFASSTFTAPIAGFYWFALNVGYGAAASNTRVYCYLKLNSSEYKRGEDKYTNALSGSAHVSAIIQMSASDTVTAFARAVGANVTAGNGQNISYFQGFLLSAT